ncbi:thrombospondin type 3 repeat-containing protein [Photobacterium leiognathi]|uniref:thrombospondin type 3 repeat-containing protein n=1 Tax=Photobacterium leiognathi TaxID=553611 RepID=UPI0029816A5B|nr:thrombospondin type 3 repeat-containing protein [Photobacterium leiognathi]
MKLKPLIVAMGFAMVPLSGCGGGDSDGEISKTKDPIPESAVTSDVYSIKAVDGYLRNAEVWLDINGNSLHDKNEPFAISKDGGVADLDVSGIDDPEQYSVMVKAIAGKTVDEDTVTETNKAGVPITKPFVLSAPAGESIISPLSTLVQINMNNQMTKEEALAKVAQDLNIETSTILSDYVESNLGDVASKANAIVELGIVPESVEELKQDIQELENKLSEHVETIKQVVAGQLIIKDENGKAVIVPNADKDDDGIIDAKDAFPEDASEWLDTDGDSIGNNKDTDDDGDGVADADDVFPLDSTESVDTDGDNIGNNKDTDDDNDGVADVDDALPLDKTESVDTDSDGIGNNKDTDDDEDGIADTDDAFPLDSSESADTDGDKIGNNKDTDDDGDSVADTDDAFPLDKTESVDTDSDGIGNNKDTDDDGDGVLDSNDAFPLDQTESVDTDGDTIGNNKDTDDDNDGVLDSNDAFPEDKSETVDTDGDGVGDNSDAFPADKSETIDTDGDGVGDNTDMFPTDKSETLDTDGDGVGDNADAFPDDKSETLDTDGDGVGDNADAFPADDSETLDTDGDGVGDNADAFPADKSETLDTDGDGVGDNADAFPEDKSETLDTDGDGVGDNADAFPEDKSETLDTDGDGVGDNADAFPADKSETLDTDGDGVGDNADAFPADKSETLDTDGDGVGDNADAFPADKSETVDTDGDGVGDNADAFPEDKSETLDTDGDGVGDNADAFPADKSETVDTDGDGVGDNADAFPADDSETLDTDGDGVGDNTDAFPADKSETVDTDGDGVGDNADAFPADKSETVDTDGDGVGDNADAFPEDKSETLDTDGDGVGDNADAFPADKSETVDTDGDGVGDNADAFPLDNTESVDTDGDGIGNNADLDDDNDGYEDAVDTDPLVALTTPSTFGECLSSLPQAFAGTLSDLKDSSLYHVSKMPLDGEIPLNTLQLISKVGELNDWQGIPGLTVIQSTVDSYRADNSSLEVDPLLAQEYEYMGTGDNEGRYFGFQDIENRWYGLNLTNAGFNKSSALNETQTVISTRVTPWAPSIDDPQEILQDITYTGKEIIEGPDGPQEVCVQSYAYDLTYINKSEDTERKDLHIIASGVNYIGDGEVLVKTVGKYSEAFLDGSYIGGYTEQIKTLRGYTKGVETIGQSPVVFKSEMDLLREEYLEYNKDTDGDGIPDSLDEFPDNPFESVDTDKDGIGNNEDLDDDNDGYEDIVDNEPLVALVTPDTYGQCLASLPQDQSYSNTDLKNSKLYQVIRTGLDSEYPSYFYQLITDQKVVDNWQETEGLSVNQSLVQLYDMSQLDEFSNPLVAEEYEYLGVGDEKGKYYGFQEINNQWYGLNLSTDGFSKLAKLNEPQQVESIRVTPWAPLKDDPQQVSEEITYVGKDIIQGPQGLQEVCVQSYNYDLTYINKSGDPGRADLNIKDSGTHYIGYGELLIKTVGNYTEYDLEGNPVWGFKEQTKSLLGYTSNNESFGSDISSFKADVEIRIKEYEELTQEPIETGNNARGFLQENSTFIEYGIDGYVSSEKLTYLFNGSKLSVNKAELTNQGSLNYFAERDFNPTYILSSDGTISVDSNSANIVDNGDGSVTYEQENQLYSDVISGKEVDLSGTNITYFLRSQKLYIPEMWDYKEQLTPGAKALISELTISEYYYLESEHCYDNATVNGVIACNSIISNQEQQYVLSDLIVADFSQSGDQFEPHLTNNSFDYGFYIQGLLVQINEFGLVKLFDEVYDSETGIYTLNEIPLSADSAWQYTNNESMISLNLKLEDENAQYGWVNQYTIENINKTLVTELDGKLVKVKRSPASVENTVFFNEIASNDIERVMAISDVNDTATVCGDSITSSVDAISANYPSAYSEVIQQCNNLSDEFDLFASNYGKVLKVVSPRGDIHVISADSVATYSQNGAYVAPIGQAVDSVFEYQVTDLGKDGTYNIVVYSQVKLADGTYSYDVWSAIAKLSDSMANYCSIGDGSIDSEDVYHNAVVLCTDPNLVSALVFHESYLNDQSLNIGGEDYSFSKNQIAVDSLGQEYSWHINDVGSLQLESTIDSQRKIITLTDIYVSINSSGEDIVSLYSKELKINDFGELSYFVTSTGIEFN